MKRNMQMWYGLRGNALWELKDAEMVNELKQADKKKQQEKKRQQLFSDN